MAVVQVAALVKEVALAVELEVVRVVVVALEKAAAALEVVLAAELVEAVGVLEVEPEEVEVLVEKEVAVVLVAEAVEAKVVE